VENPVDNRLKRWWISCCRGGPEEIHQFIYSFQESFPPFFDGKRYKLINFAPKTKSVDNYRSQRRVSELASTKDVESLQPRVDNLFGKCFDWKFYTYQRHIILHIFVFSKKRKDKKIIL